MKCVDIYPHNENDVLLAIGQINGKVILSTFGPTVFDCLGLAGKELGKLVYSHSQLHSLVCFEFKSSFLKCLFQSQDIPASATLSHGIQQIPT